MTNMTNTEQAIQQGTVNFVLTKPTPSTQAHTTKGESFMNKFTSSAKSFTSSSSKAFTSAKEFATDKVSVDYVSAKASTVWASIKDFYKDLYKKTKKMMPVVAKSASTYAVASVAAMVTGGSVIAFGLTAVAFYAFMEWVISKIKGTEFDLSKAAATGFAYSVIGTFLATFVFVLTANFTLVLVSLFI